jgi:hypothetical protein
MSGHLPDSPGDIVALEPLSPQDTHWDGYRHLIASARVRFTQTSEVAIAVLRQ